MDSSILLIVVVRLKNNNLAWNVQQLDVARMEIRQQDPSKHTTAGRRHFELQTHTQVEAGSSLRIKK